MTEDIPQYLADSVIEDIPQYLADALIEDKTSILGGFSDRGYTSISLCLSHPLKLFR